MHKTLKAHEEALRVAVACITDIAMEGPAFGQRPSAEECERRCQEAITQIEAILGEKEGEQNA